MAGEYPRLLMDRDVTVIRDSRPEPTRLRAWLDGHDGPMPSYRVELAARLGNYTCPYTATGPDMFEALVRLRRQLEPDGMMIAVQGARRDSVLVTPKTRVVVAFDADNPGWWALHCHLLYHQAAGMFATLRYV